MPTGALIRDFYKESRELRYTNQGSIRLSEIEKNAYRNALTIEITDIDSPRYANLKTLPDNTHYGYATQFRGSSVVDCDAIKFAKFRLLDILNPGIWAYHQSTESQRILYGLVDFLSSEVPQSIIEALSPDIAEVLCFAGRWINNAGPLTTPADEWIIQMLGCDAFVPAERASNAYRALPIASPFPDVIKFKSDVPCSFLFRLESWYLLNPAVYILESPTDDGDQTEGEDEYPQPEVGDGDGDGTEFPSPSPKDAESDPRDYGSSNEPPPFIGGQCADYYNVTVEYSDVFVGTPRYVARTVTVLGPIFGLGPLSETNSALAVRAAGGNVSTGLANLPFPCASQPQFFQNCRAKIVSISKVNGSADNCGNPPQSATGQI